MRDGGLWSAPRYWAVFPHVFFFLVFKMYLFIYPFGLFWADSVSYLKVTRMEPFGQSPIFSFAKDSLFYCTSALLKTLNSNQVYFSFLFFSFSSSYIHSFCSDTPIISLSSLFFPSPLFEVSMHFSPCFSFPGLTFSIWVDLKQVLVASGMSLGLVIWVGSR